MTKMENHSVSTPLNILEMNINFAGGKFVP